MGLIDRLVIFFTGKKIAMIGPRGAGKTTLRQLFTDGSQPLDPEQTAGPERVKGSRKGLGPTVKGGTDLPGGASYYDEWKEAIEESDIVIYLFDAHQARTSEQYRLAINNDRLAMQKWGVWDRKNLYLVGTHTDTDPDYTSRAAYTDTISDIDTIIAMKTKIKDKGCRLHLDVVSLMDRSDVKRLGDRLGK